MTTSQSPLTLVPEDVKQVIDNGMLQHIAVIMDGNRRWAKVNKLPALQGHYYGYKNLHRLIEYCSRDLQLPAMTVFAFSTENWKRSQLEVRALMKLFNHSLRREIDEMVAQNIRLRFIGDLTGFSHALQKQCQEAEAQTSGNTGMIFQVAMNYGGRAEILEACRQIASKVQSGQLSTDDITEETLNQYLYTQEVREPDLVIRTGGEYRLSNFLLWQAAYAEIYVDHVFWPEFSPERLNLAIREFQHRQRRFGS